MSNAQEQAQAQYESVVAALANLKVDYDRLDDEELMAQEYASYDEAYEALMEGPLEVAYRSGWGAPSELYPEEFYILLCTGGPAVRIRGELDNSGSPHRAWLEYQDWFTEWTQLHRADPGVLLEYAAHFVGV